MNSKQKNQLLCLVFFLSLGCSPVTAIHAESQATKKSIDKTSIELGKRIYRQGILSSGELLQGYVQGDIPVKGTQLACIHCHKRSGLGSSEGNIVTPTITGDVLYAPDTSRASELLLLRKAEKKTRPAYNDDTLIRAISEGKNPADRSLDLLMPHYSLNDTDQKNLISYLKSLSSADSPGVDDTEIQIATIFTDTVPIDQKRATLRVLYRFIKDWNTDTRPHTRRAQNAPWHKKWHYESHRTWSLNIWTLEGPPDTWQSQLELMYGRKPVFAILGGVANGEDWSPIHNFCESYEVPCLFPSTNLPVTTEKDFYSIYFSKGLTLESEVLAKHILSSDKYDKSTRITQIYTRDLTSQTPAKAFREKLAASSFSNVKDIEVDGNGNLLNNDTNSKIDLNNTDILVFWLNKKQYKKFNKEYEKIEVYLSGGLLEVEAGINESTNIIGSNYVIYPYAKPALLERRMSNTQKWMKLRKIRFTNRRLQSNSLFAATLLSRAIKHMGSNFSRDYLIEKIEHLDRNISLSPMYSRLSLGPGQRFASKGAYIAKGQPGGKETLKIVSDWIVP